MFLNNDDVMGLLYDALVANDPEACKEMVALFNDGVLVVNEQSRVGELEHRIKELHYLVRRK